MDAALRGAVDDVHGLGKGLDVTLRQVQFEQRGDERIPIHGGPGDPEGDFNAINGRGCRARATRTCRTGRASSWPRTWTAQVPRTAHDPHLLAVDEPGLAVLRRPDAHVLAQAWVDPGFCEREILADRNLTIQRFGKVRCTSRRTITYRLPLRKRGERLRPRARDGQRQAGEGERVGRRGVRVSLRGRPKGRYRIRVTAKTSRKRTIKLDCRARTRAKKKKKAPAVRRAPALAAAGLAVVHAAPAAAQFDPAYEASNFSKTNERAAIHSTPDYQACSLGSPPPTRPRPRRSRRPTPSARSSARPRAGRTARPARATRACTTGSRRTTGRWCRWCSAPATGRRCPGACGSRARGRRGGPGIVIVNGSVQASETLYWFAAQTLAKAGYVVLTFDPQNQGRSDSQRRGARPAGGLPGPERRPPVLRRRPGRAGLLPLDAVRAVPAASELQVGHLARAQAGAPRRPGAQRRLQPAVAADRRLADRHRRALVRRRRRLLRRSAGPRVKAVVAWDALREPSRPACEADRGPASTRPSAPRRAITKPALNLTADYFIPPAPNASSPTTRRRRRRRRPTARRASTRARSPSAAARTTSSPGSPTRRSAPRCAARTSPPGTRRPGSTPTSRATRARCGACARTAGAPTRRRPPSTPTATRT